MNELKPRGIYREALNKWGAEAQTLMVFEEMSELQKELCKHARGKDNREAIAEEIADVQIMLEQMMILHDCEDLVEVQKFKKTHRLKVRLEQEKWEYGNVQIAAKIILMDLIMILRNFQIIALDAALRWIWRISYGKQRLDQC